MKYLAMPQGTAEWLLLKSGLIDAVHSFITTEYPLFGSVRGSTFADGPIRLSLSENGSVVCLWNTDYLTGTGRDAWGFVLLDTDGGLLAQPDIGREVLERCIYVINQRLQGLLLDGAYIHRSFDSGAHSCLAGRGARARHFTVGYFERTIETNKVTQKSLICVGPIYDPTFAAVSQRATKEARKLATLISEANQTQAAALKPAAVSSTALTRLADHLAPFTRAQSESEYSSIQVATKKDSQEQWDPYRVQGLSFEEWIDPTGPLTPNQRRILDNASLTKAPIRIVGPGGSGKTVLMQLLATKLYRDAISRNQEVRILYVVHNSAMRQKVLERFETLLRQSLKTQSEGSRLDVSTLTEYGQGQLGISTTAVIDSDAHEAKAFQLERVREALEETFRDQATQTAKSELLMQISTSSTLKEVFASLLMIEISTAIKGHGLEQDRKRYVESELSLSRLHGVLKTKERDFVFEVFSKYRAAVFDYFEVLDTDDIALSLLGKLRTPLWELKRKQLGYDFVFVDETQLFNENERRVFPLLSRGTTAHIPIALALDEAQQLYGQRSAGLATLGIKDITNESLPSIHRSTKSIVRLAFFVVQRCTDLFSADFPDFTSIADVLVSDNHPLAEPPRFLRIEDDLTSITEATLGLVRQLRTSNVRQIGVICHAEQYWDTLQLGLQDEHLPLFVMQQRGERTPSSQPVVVFSRPAHIGGQEFDAVIAVGLEQGMVPPRIVGNEALASAVEQQALREIYLSVTRARYKFISILPFSSSPSAVLEDARRAGIIA